MAWNGYLRMRRLAWPRKRWALIASCSLLLMSCGLLGVMTWPKTPDIRRIEAQQRWAARPFTNYRVIVRVEFANNVCFQDLEAEGDRLRRIVRNTCMTSWFSLLTVARMFEIGERLEWAPACYPSSLPCTCQTVRVGDIAYDERLGYPLAIMYSREIRPNWTRIDYWQHLWELKRLPSCGPLSRRVNITVVSLTPLP